MFLKFTFISILKREITCSSVTQFEGFVEPDGVKPSCYYEMGVESTIRIVGCSPKFKLELFCYAGF